MNGEDLDLDILLELKIKVNESYNGKKIPASELSLFAEKMDNGEEPKRFYDAKTSNTEEGNVIRGRILLTNDKLIFIGNPGGNRIGAVIKHKDLVGAEIDVNERDKSMATLTLIVEDEMMLEYQFEMSRFGLEALANYIMGMAIKEDWLKLWH